MEQIIKDLEQMAQEDQEVLASDDSDKQKEVLTRNTKKLKGIINNFGWPTISKFGQKAATAAWLITQHSDHDLEFQKQVLQTLKFLPRNEVLLKNIAYLEDRVLVGANKPQLYGTQFYVDDQGNYNPRPITEKEKVEERWQMMGLNVGPWPKFADYQKFMIERFKNKH